MVSARGQAVLFASSVTIFLSALAHPRDDRAFWKRTLSPPVYPRQQDCIPPEPAETITDRLNTLLNSSGPGYILPLCQNTTYRLTAPLIYAAESQEISTVGYPIGDERATLVVDGFWNDTNGHSIAVQGNCIGCNGIKLRNIQINGARNGRGPIQGGGNIEFGGPNANQLIEYVNTYNPRSWTCLHVAEGVLNCLIQNNTIWIEDNTLLGGINVVDYDPFNGDYTNTIVENNTIIGGFATDQSTDTQDANLGYNNETAIIKLMGLAVGNRVWFGDKFGRNRNFGGIVRNNRLTGAFGWGVVVSGTRDFTVENNEVVGNSTFIGFRGVNCSITGNYPDVRLDGALLCITSPDGGDYWPRGGSPYGNPDKDEAGAEGEGGSAPSHQGSSTSRKLGLGLGITFGILAALIAAWFVHRWAVKKYAPTNSPATPPKF
ncbi:unnamed protein product [Rhizoctonia solani]|uniref:Right handed beta helix domain-containing protein n=1 Tax=Rhizoctonia solani TaxID=456999 RepID=A0A8H3CIX9_9AGAM|nr:unnamed protein product [Rhizoctonia solani]